MCLPGEIHRSPVRFCNVRVYKPGVHAIPYEGRLQLARAMQTRDGTVTVSVDDTELDQLTFLLRDIHGDIQPAKLVWDRNRKNDARYFSVGHEYMTVYARDREYLRKSGVTFREPKEGIEEARACFTELRARHNDNWNTIRSEWLGWFDRIPVADPRRRLMRYSKAGPRGPYRDDRDISWPGGGGPRYEVLHPETKKPCRIPLEGGYSQRRSVFGKRMQKAELCLDLTSVLSRA